MKALLISIAFLGLLGCKRKTNQEKHIETIRDKNLEITIEYAQSSKIDLTRKLYTVYNIDRPQFDTNFQLLPAEKDQIIEKYYSLALYNLTEVDTFRRAVYITDNCMNMPKLYTTLTFKTNQTIQKIQIDGSCDNYSNRNKIAAEKVNDFLQLVANIIMTKPVVKNAPASDIIYY